MFWIFLLTFIIIEGIRIFRSKFQFQLTDSMLFWTSASFSGSNALVISSNTNMSGWHNNARAIASRCFWPVEIWTPPSPIFVSNFWKKNYDILYRKLALLIAYGLLLVMFEWSQKCWPFCTLYQLWRCEWKIPHKGFPRQWLQKCKVLEAQKKSFYVVSSCARWNVHQLKSARFPVDRV